MIGLFAIPHPRAGERPLSAARGRGAASHHPLVAAPRIPASGLSLRAQRAARFSTAPFFALRQNMVNRVPTQDSEA